MSHSKWLWTWCLIFFCFYNSFTLYFPLFVISFVCSNPSHFCTFQIKMVCCTCAIVNMRNFFTNFCFSQFGLVIFPFLHLKYRFIRYTMYMYIHRIKDLHIFSVSFYKQQHTDRHLMLLLFELSCFFFIPPWSCAHHFFSIKLKSLCVLR